MEIRSMNCINKVSNKVKKINWICVWGGVIICFIVFPILFVSLYSLPLSDDLGNATLLKMRMDGKYFYGKAALEMTAHLYKTLSGYYFSAFLNYFISPLLRGGINGLRGAVFCINLFFYFSLYYFTAYLLKKVYKVKKEGVVLWAGILVLFAFTNNYNHSEMWAWYCALVAYVLVIAIMFWGIIFFIKALKSSKKHYIVLASIAGFLVSGGSLNVTALNCICYLLIGYIGYRFYDKRKISVICFGSALTGAIVNVLSPGNYSRHEGISNSYPIVSSLKSAAFLTWSRFQDLLFYSPFILLLVVFFLLAYKYFNFDGHMNYVNPIIFLCGVCMVVTVINFPVCLGYSMGHFPDRCIWVEDCGIYLGMFCWIIYLAGWVKNRFEDIKIEKDMLLCIMVSCLFFVCNLGSVRDFDSYPSIQMAKQLTNGKISEFADFWEDIFEEIESSQERDVVIYRGEMKTNDFIWGPSIELDYVQGTVASYYDKDWVQVVVSE